MEDLSIARLIRGQTQEECGFRQIRIEALRLFEGASRIVRHRPFIEIDQGLTEVGKRARLRIQPKCTLKRRYCFQVATGTSQFAAKQQPGL